MFVLKKRKINSSTRPRWPTDLAASEDLAITSDTNFAADVDPILREPLKVLQSAKVDIDQVTLQTNE